MDNARFHIPDNEEYRALKKFIEEHRNTPGPLIQVLHKAQSIFGYLPPEVQKFVSSELNVPLSEIYGVVTFYNFFRTEPIGKHVINVCTGTACHVKGSKVVLEALCKELGVEVGGTTEDKFYTISTARCFGACGLAPVMVIDEEVFGRLSPQKAINIIKDFKKAEEN